MTQVERFWQPNVRDVAQAANMPPFKNYQHSKALQLYHRDHRDVTADIKLKRDLLCFSTTVLTYTRNIVLLFIEILLQLIDIPTYSRI